MPALILLFVIKIFLYFFHVAFLSTALLIESRVFCLKLIEFRASLAYLGFTLYLFIKIDLISLISLEYISKSGLLSDKTGSTCENINKRKVKFLSKF